MRGHLVCGHPVRGSVLPPTFRVALADGPQLMGRTNPYRHPLGRTCRDKRVLFTALLLMPYALGRYAVDCMRGRP